MHLLLLLSGLILATRGQLAWNPQPDELLPDVRNEGNTLFLLWVQDAVKKGFGGLGDLMFCVTSAEEMSKCVALAGAAARDHLKNEKLFGSDYR
jgi:hypothetical protein